MSSSYFLLLRRLKDSNAYVRELAKQFALFRSVSDQVENSQFKAYNRLKTYRLLFKENPTVAQAPASEYQPFIPGEGTPRPPPPEQPPSPPPPPVQATKFVYPNSSITVSSNDTSGNFTGPGGMNDNNFSTGWHAANSTMPQWVKIDLGSSKQIHYLTLRWTSGPAGTTDTVTYNIETSPDNSSWTTRFNGSNIIIGGNNQTWTADVPNHDSRYVRVNITNRTFPGAFAGIVELGVWGLSAGTPSPPPSPPGTQQDHKFIIPNNAIHETTEAFPVPGRIIENLNDGNLNTSWSTAGLPLTVQFDLGEVKRVAFVRVAWWRGDERVCGYSIATGATAGGGMTVRRTGVSSGQTTGFEHIGFTDVNARWLDFTITSNSQSDFASISELEIWGGDILTSTPPPPGPPSPPAPPSTPTPPPSTPTPTGTISMMLNFNNTIDDASGQLNHALMDGGTMRFGTGATSALGNAIALNPLSATTINSLTDLLPKPQAATSRIKYHGGPVLNKYTPEIINIWWGSSWNSGTPASRRQTLINDMNTICNSEHFGAVWQYGNVKKPRVTHNIIWTGTALPSGSNATFAQINNCIDDVVDSGQVPNYDLFGERFPNRDDRMDYRHIYFVILPDGKFNPPGYAGASSLSFRNQGTGPPFGTIWYNWSSLNGPFVLNPSTPQYNEVQMFEQAWAHEVFHHLESPYPGNCTTSEGYTGYVYDFNGECNGMQHSSAGCGVRYRVLTGTSILTESYWSDLDGGCVAPGSGDSWTRDPSVTPPSPPPPPITETFEKLWVPFSNSTQIIINTSPGFSVFCRIFPYTLTAPATGVMRCLWIKQDDLNNAAQVLLGSDGTVYFHVKKDNERYKVRTTPGVMTTNSWYDCWFTFNKSTNDATIYINNIRYSEPSTASEQWNNRHSHFIIGNSSTGSSTAPYRGKIDDFRLYRNGVVGTTQVQNMWENQHTIDTIPIGQDKSVFIVGFTKIDDQLKNNVFETADFDPTILPPSPPALPPPPPGTDDKPEETPEGPEPTICTFEE